MLGSKQIDLLWGRLCLPGFGHLEETFLIKNFSSKHQTQISPLTVKTSCPLLKMLQDYCIILNHYPLSPLGEQRASISTLCHTSLFQCFVSLTGVAHFQEIAEGPTSKQLYFIYKWIYESHIFQLQRRIWLYDCSLQLHTQLLKLCV